MCGRARTDGFSLVELLIVVTLIGLLAFSLLPDQSLPEQQKQAAATGEVVDALEFARQEARRREAYVGVRFGPDGHTLGVFALTISPPPPVEDYSIYHPVDKRLYQLDLDHRSFTRGTKLAANFVFASGATDQAVAFDPRGEPVSSGDLSMMQSGVVAVDLGRFTGTVNVASVTGRVTSQ